MCQTDLHSRPQRLLKIDGAVQETSIEFFSHKIVSNGAKRKGFTEKPKFISINNE
jgi:hypothetical protein